MVTQTVTIIDVRRPRGGGPVRLSCSTIQWLAAFIALAGLLVSCSITPKSAPTPASQFPTAKDSAGAALLPEINRASIYDRAGVRFERADFFKPSNPVEGDLGFTLAPLFLQEVVGETASNVLTRVSFSTDSIQINGRPHVRYTYSWPRIRANDRLLQAVRITLSTDGQPIIWELLWDYSGADLIYVAQRLENAAKAEFGEPLTGRRFAAERDPAQARETVVARVLDDGPVAMGPVLYLAADSGSVSTLICRCMPSQAREVRVTASYELVADPAVGNVFQHRASIENRLRLPSSL